MYEKLPDSIKQDGLFVLWKYEMKDGQMTKVPYQVNGRRANPADAATFDDYDTVIKAVSGYNGISLGAFRGYGMIDIDHCIEDGELSPLAEDIVNALDSYTEISPSGTGIRIVIKAVDFPYDVSKYYINNRSIGVEIYISGATNRVCTLTGNAIREVEVAERGAELSVIMDKYMLRPTPMKQYCAEDVPGSYLSDESVIEKATNSKQYNGLIN